MLFIIYNWCKININNSSHLPSLPPPNFYYLYEYWTSLVVLDFPGGSDGKASVYNAGVEKAMATHSSTLAWKIPWTEEPGGLQTMGSLRVGHDWATSLSLFTFMNWRRKWQPTPVFLPGESRGRGSLMGCRLWGRIESDTTEACLSSSSSTMGETRVQSLGWEDSLEKEMAIHSSTIAWKSHGQRSLVGYSPWGRKESDTTERLHFHFSLVSQTVKNLPAMKET